MKLAEIEIWAHSIIDRVQQQQPVEDSRVELKAEWTDKYHQFARRLAGHANAAQGEPILWLIGVKEGVGVTGADAVEFGSWWRQVSKHFDQLTPRPTEVAVSVSIGAEQKTAVAILFETDRAPYVVINPNFSQSKGEIKYEVPWREGTSVRTADRADLLRVLIPQQKLPHLEVLWAELYARTNTDFDPGAITWQLEAHVFIEQTEGRVSLPRHRCAGSIDMDSGWKIPLRDFALEIDESETRANSVATNNVATFAAPGVLIISATQRVTTLPEANADWQRHESVEVELLMRPVGTANQAGIKFNLRRVKSSQEETSWRFGERVQRLSKFEEWAQMVEHDLIYGDSRTYEILDHERDWAARAVREQRLAWMKGVPATLVLPS